MSLLIKICGLSTPETLDVALEAGADMVGFVFFPPSPRNVSFDVARTLSARVKGRAKKVVLSVDADDALLSSVVDALAPDFLQLHGSELPERVSAIKARFRLPVIKALPVETRADFARVKDYAAVCDWLLFDAKAPADATRPGGLGKPFDWSLMRGIVPGVPVMLSGGLDVSNVADAIRIAEPSAIDVSSGVESSPGRKDVKKIREFIRRASQAYLDTRAGSAVSHA